MSLFSSTPNRLCKMIVVCFDPAVGLAAWLHILYKRIQKCNLFEASVATRGRTLTSARSPLTWLTTGVFTQAIISDAEATASRFSLSLVNYWLFVVRSVIIRWTSLTVFNSLLWFALLAPAVSAVDQVANNSLIVLSSLKCFIMEAAFGDTYSARGFYCPCVKYNAFYYISLARTNNLFVKLK